MSRTVDARSLLPAREDRNSYGLLPFKEALASEFGPEPGFDIYKELLELPDSVVLTRRPLRSLRAFASERATSFTDVFPAGEPYSVDPPRVIGEGNQRPLVGTSRSFFVACLEDARIFGMSELIEAGGMALRDYQGDERSRIPERLEVDAAVFHASGDTVWTIEDRAAHTLEIDEAFGSLLGVHSSQFGHWMWEFLPKYLTAVASGALPRVPVLVPIEMPPTHRAALELLAPDTELVDVSAFWVASVRRLWCAPTLVYMPLLPHLARDNPSIDHAVAPPRRYRPTLQAMARAADRAGLRATGSERIYLARTDAHQRRLENRLEIEQLVQRYGFTIVHPEDLDFAQQVSCIRAARYIVGPEGSANFLAMFARPGTKQCHLSPPFTIYEPVHDELLKEAGAELTVFTGPAVRANDATEYPFFGQQQHADYRIDAAAFARFLDEWLA